MKGLISLALILVFFCNSREPLSEWTWALPGLALSEAPPHVGAHLQDLPDLKKDDQELKAPWGSMRRVSARRTSLS